MPNVLKAGKPGLTSSPLVILLHFFWNCVSLGVSDTRFLRAGCPSFHPTSSVKALIQTRESHSHWPRHFLIIVRLTVNAWIKQ